MFSRESGTMMYEENQNRFDTNKSTKGASKLRRDLINAEITNLRDLLPLPPSTRQRLSQLQLMALVCVYVRKANYFQQVFKRHEMGMHHLPTPNIGFSKALSGFLMMMTQNGKLLYISDNAAEYLGHSMEDLLIHGDSVYDMIDKQDHAAIQSELVRSANTHGDDQRLFLCRMNVSRNARRQMRFGDQKVVLVQGHYLSFLPLCSRNEPVFLATCTPVAMPETRECVVQGATNVFTSIHAMDMKFLHIDKNGEFHLGFPRNELQGISWYQLLHWDCMREAQSKLRLITQSEQDRSCILLLRLQRRAGDWLWVHCVLQVKDNMENSQQPVIVCTNQVLSEREASVMRANSWLYHYYMVQTKLQYGLAYEAHAASRMTAPYYQPPPQTYHQEAAAAPPPPVAAYHQMSPLAGHQPALHHPHVITHASEPVAAFRYSSGRRAEPEPVDYSLHPLHLKRETLTKVEHSPGSSPSSEVIVDLDCGGGGGGGSGGEGGPLTVSGAGAAGHVVRSRVLVKAAAAVQDPADLIDQWNPSPPWSDTTVQKVPDILHQELSPYVTTTPPTPGSAVSLHNAAASTAFTFDWAPEQFVPASHHSAPHHDYHFSRVLSYSHQQRSPTQHIDDEPHHLTNSSSSSSSTSSWSTDAGHRNLFPLQPPPAVRPSLIVRLDSAPEPMDHQSSHVKDTRNAGTTMQ